MISQSQESGKALRSLFADPVTIIMLTTVDFFYITILIPHFLLYTYACMICLLNMAYPKCNCYYCI